MGYDPDALVISRRPIRIGFSAQKKFQTRKPRQTTPFAPVAEGFSGFKRWTFSIIAQGFGTLQLHHFFSLRLHGL